MARTRKKARRRRSKKGLKRTKDIKKRSNNIKITIKNLGKKRKYKRLQYGCSNNNRNNNNRNNNNSNSNMKGGGPLFQPLSDVGTSLTGGLGNMYNTLAGNDNYSNQIVSHPMSSQSNYN
jgi:hypothetical protein